MNLIWKQNGNILKDASHDKPLVFPVTYPSTVGDSYTVTLSSASRSDGTFSVLNNVRLYIAGPEEDINTVLNVWPNYGADKTPPRPELNGGIEISFDRGLNFIRLGYDSSSGNRLGFPEEPSTWILLPGICIVPGGQSGVLGILDLATISIRYVIPPQADQFQVFRLRLEAAFDPL